MILLAGPPGAGKSVQARLLSERNGYRWISVGRELRNTLDEGYHSVMERGELVPDDVVQDILVAAIKDTPHEQRVIIDGFPRRQSQVDWFIEFVSRSERTLKGIVHIYIPENVTLQRLAKRHRNDDDMSVVHERYLQYKNQIVPMLEGFSEGGTPVVLIKGDRPIETVYLDIQLEIKHMHG